VHHSKFPLLRHLLHLWLIFGLMLAVTAFPSRGQYQRPEIDRRQERLSMMDGLLERTLTLNDLWFVQSSEKVKAPGEKISEPGFKIEGWYPAVVPSTVMGTLVQNNLYPDLLVGENLKSVSEAPFQVSWWYRRELVVPPGPVKRNVQLEFDGINYRANVWLNGKKVAGAAETFGPFRRFSIEVTATAKPGDKNVLAVEVFPPKKGDFTIGFVDWNPKPPDGNMGLWRDVRVRTTGDVAINFPFVMTKLDVETLKEAKLTVSAELQNHTNAKVSGTLEGRIQSPGYRPEAGFESRGTPSGSPNFKDEITLEPRETRTVVFTPEKYPELVVKEPRVWWTYDLGKPELYLLQLSFRPKSDKARAEAEAAAFSDIRTVRFGIREVSDYINEQGFRGFKLNGRKVLIRGGGWTDDIFLDNRAKKVADQVRYARQANLNAIRLEGFWGTGEDLYDLCDQNGILVMAGWSCQWEWENLVGKPNDEFGCVKTLEDIKLIAQSWRDQVRWLRNHPSIFVWMEGSDTNPRPELEKEYIAILKEDDPTRPAVTSAKERTSALTGPSAVKMRGPYDYVPPVYWYADKANGGAFGFNTETGPGPQVPPLDSIEKMIPAKDLWPINDVWYYHCARGEFFGLKRYNEAMDHRLGPAKDVEDYATKAQFLNYEGMRAMFEAFVANRYKATGVIQWMYNSAWPKFWWQLFDYYLNPTGALYGARKAGEPVHLIYNYATREIIAVNNTREPAEKLKAVIKVYDFGLKAVVSKMAEFALQADEVKTIDTLHIPDGLTPTYFLDLRILKGKDVLVGDNFYCLSAKPETLDWEKAEWYVTPVKDYADLTALANLRPVKLRTKGHFSEKGPRCEFTADIENPSDTLAFQIEISVVKDLSNEKVLPVFLDDNYITLLPGEKRRIAGFFDTEDLGGQKPVLKVKGWNITP
jgi:exo-1,4-beta-D-glucosaminidase